MKRSLAMCLATTCLCAASTAHAHHSHGAIYDLCKSVSVEGQIESVEWKNPHTWFVVKTDAGTTYHVEWTGVQMLARQGVGGPAQDAVTYGARVVVTGHPPKDATIVRANYPSFKDDPDPKVIDPTQIRRPDAGFNWAVAGGPIAPECGGR